MEQFTLQGIRTFNDDRLLGVVAVKRGGGCGDAIDLTEQVNEGAEAFIGSVTLPYFCEKYYATTPGITMLSAWKSGIWADTARLT